VPILAFFARVGGDAAGRRFDLLGDLIERLKVLTSLLG
jgi:hypothetical protein